MRLSRSFCLFVVCFILMFIVLVNGWGRCREAICGPRVSKCMLIKSCNCSISEDIKTNNCTCCKDCIKCLGDLYKDCCSCVGLCREPKELDPRLAMKSYIEDLEPDDGQRNLFDMIMSSEEDELQHEQAWTVERFPALQNKFFYKDNHPQDLEKDKLLKLWENVNCTVAYMHHCLSVEKCRQACESVGASSYRWFHTGCCECVGDDCLNYGSRQGKCSKCGELAELDKNTVISSKATGEL